jgi:hypothetical protein
MLYRGVLGDFAMLHKGSCHCGRIAFEVEGDLTQAVDCNCSHCRRKGYLMWFVPRKKLKLSAWEGDLATYTFNRHVIRHHFCPVCGCALFGFGVARSGVETAAINVHCLENVDRSRLMVVPFDGRSL